MSLIKRLMMTPEKLAANQANARQSQGPATPEGLKRVRQANLLHGYYSKAPRETMRALGENPDDFDRLLESLNGVWQPQNDYEQNPVRRLARLMWRLDRADRVQEAMTVYQVETLERNVDRQNKEDAARQKNVAAALDRLRRIIWRQAESAAEMLLKLKAGGQKRSKKTKNEGRSHDVHENKDQVLEHHDVYENTGLTHTTPRYC